MTPAAALPWGLAAAALVVAAGFAWAYARAKARAAALEAELAVVLGADRHNEYRLERFDLIWYPVVSYQEKDKVLARASPGVPFCRKCVKPLAPDDEGWKCPGCGARSPDSIADTAATDSIVREAIRCFLQRRPDYRAAPELERLA